MRAEHIIRNLSSTTKSTTLRAMVWQLSGYAAIGVATVASLTLPPAERGQLAATMNGAILGAAFAGMSVDTYLPTRDGPPGWFLRRRATIATTSAAIAGTAGALALAIVHFSRAGSAPLAFAGAVVGSGLIMASALALRNMDVRSVQRARALGSMLYLALALALSRFHVESAGAWALCWASNVALSALILMWNQHHSFRRSAHTPDDDFTVRGLSTLHAGVLAQTVTYRSDQVFLSRAGDTAALGQYSIAVAVLEAATGPSQVFAQRALSARHRGDRRSARVMALSAGAALVIGLPAVAALWLISRYFVEYGDLAIFGLLLLPGIAAVSASKPGSAYLAARGRVLTTTVIAVVIACVSILAYAVAAPAWGGAGVALASSFVYLVHLALTSACVARANREGPASAVAEAALVTRDPQPVP